MKVRYEGGGGYQLTYIRGLRVLDPEELKNFFFCGVD